MAPVGRALFERGEAALGSTIPNGKTGVCIPLVMFMLLVVAIAVWTTAAIPVQGSERVEIIRDQWGIAHVYADSNAGVFFGAGYATAQDRMLQMELFRRKVAGRLAEVLGPEWLQSDKLMRTLGLYRHAQRVVDHLSPDTREALEAYAAGVNHYLATEAGNLNPTFARLGIVPEPWTPADSIAVWMRIAEYFDTSWKQEVNSLRQRERQQEAGGGSGSAGAVVIDDAAAVVEEQDFARTSPDVYQRLKSYPRAQAEDDGWERVKASHAWAVSGEKTVTGKPLLESDPQIAVTLPSLWYEIHLSGGDYNARGIGLAGAPGFLIGWNEHLAWGATALGCDGSDLFQERLSPAGNEYQWRGVWYPVETRNEKILVKGAEPVVIKVKETRHGPLVDDFLAGRRPDEHFALHHTLLQETTTSIEGLLAMMRARNWTEFTEGLRQYRSPGLHIVYADADGNIGYHTAAAIPVRRGVYGIPQVGWSGEEEWAGYIPFEELPHVLNPSRGFIASANHLPVGSWYPHNLTIGTGGTGHNGRSWRLYELLEAGNSFSVEAFGEIHRDNINPIARDLVRVARILRERGLLSREALAFLSRLDEWDGRLTTLSPEATLAETLLAAVHRSLRPDGDTATLAARFGGGFAGVAFLLRTVLGEYERSGEIPLAPEVAAWVERVLRQAAEKAPKVPSRGPVEARPQRMVYQANLEGFPSLDPQADRLLPRFTTTAVETIWSQLGNSYTQIVDLADIDNSRSFLPPGISEDPRSRHYFDQVDLWVKGETHPAPLSREGVLRYQESVTELEWEGLKPVLKSAAASEPKPLLIGNILRGVVVTSRGGRSRAQTLSPATAAFLEERFLQLFNYATTENAFKWREMEPVRGQVDYSEIDAIVQWALDHDIVLKGHTLVWGNQGKQGVPAWLEEVPRQEVEALLKNRVQEIVARYAGRVDIWDVLNEPLHERWFEFIPDYAVKVFQWAREANPKALLLINEYGVLTEDGATKYAQYVRDLLEKGAPIDAIGIQAHISEPVPADQLRRALDILAGVGLPLHITELSVPSSGPMGRQAARNWTEEAQAEYLELFFRTAIAHPAVEAITMWGLWDGDIWRPGTGLIDADLRLKPSFFALERVLGAAAKVSPPQQQVVR
ncbi:MAG TPA: hypothetical protein GXX55_01560 [Firmicutes bacterium]|nr:hypothetical protein [Bacillota bacterium]